MSLTALLPEGTVRLARDVTKQEGPFKCTFCEAQMVIKKGQIKVDHFAHAPDSTCPYSTGESEEHYRSKLEIYDLLR